MNALSIVIVNWNALGLLRECLDSIRENPPPFACETIVVDNASGDGSASSVAREYPWARLIANPRNLGFAAACNQGARAASAALLVFLNPDARVHAGTLAGAASFMDGHPEAGIMGCRTLNPDGSPQASAFAFPGKLRIFAYVAGLNRFFKLSRFTDHSTLSTPDYVQGSFLAVRREIFEKCGGFDESFFLYFEEVDLCRRVKAAGSAVYYYPGISITHHGGASGGNSPAGLGHFIASGLKLFRKYRGAREEDRLRRALRRALRLRLLLGFIRSPRGFASRREALTGVLAGLDGAEGRE